MYHYTECGLDNVWLENGYHEKRTPYGKAVSVEDADGLHKVIAMSIANKKGKLTGKELRFMRNLLELSQANFAKAVGQTEQSVSLWERTGKVPLAADLVVRMLVSEKLNGNAKISEVLKRINDVDRLVNQRIVAKEQRHQWKSRFQVVEDEGFALAA